MSAPQRATVFRKNGVALDKHQPFPARQHLRVVVLRAERLIFVTVEPPRPLRRAMLLHPREIAIQIAARWTSDNSPFLK